MSHFSAKTAKKTPFYCFSPRFKSRHLNHKKSDTGLEGRQGENISPQVGGIYRRQNNGYPLFSMRVRSRRKSRHLNHKKSKRHLVAYFFLYSKVIRDLRGGKAKIFRRRSEESTDDKTTDTRCFPCASAQGASPVTSTTKKVSDIWSLTFFVFQPYSYSILSCLLNLQVY